MDNTKNDQYYIEKVLTDLRFLIRHTKDIDRDSFQKDELLLDSIMFRFIQISEHIKKLTTSFKDKHSNIPWKNIIGLRNRIVHEYGNVDLNIIFDAVTKDIYGIVHLFESIHFE
jgi:uncharacterized protein with HEPN domain